MMLDTLGAVLPRAARLYGDKSALVFAGREDRPAHLERLRHAALEGGALDFEQLVPLQQRGYLAYALAAATQERIVSLLGP